MLCRAISLVSFFALAGCVVAQSTGGDVPFDRAHIADGTKLKKALAAIKKLADGRLCSPGPMQYAVTAALSPLTNLTSQFSSVDNVLNALPDIQDIVTEMATDAISPF